jgi:predicted outer membrane lipoprotein
MKLTGTSELAAVVVLVGLIAFMPKVLGFLVESQVGKAVAFGFVAFLWKQHNELLALLLAVAFVKAAPAYEHLDMPKKEDKDAMKAKAMAMAAKGEQA